MAGGKGKGTNWRNGSHFLSGVCIISAVYHTFTRLHPGHPLPEAAAAELHPDVPPKPGT